MTESATRTPRWATLKRYLTLAYGALGTMFDVGLLVVGSILVGLAAAVLLIGLGIIQTDLGLSTGPTLVSGLVLGVTGLFCMGLASEGPLGRGRRLAGFKIWEVGIGRTLAVFGVGFGALLLYGVLDRLPLEVPAILGQGMEAFRVVGVTGMTAMPILGVPLGLLVRWAPLGRDWVNRLDVPVMFAVWAIAALVVFT